MPQESTTPHGAFCAVIGDEWWASRDLSTYYRETSVPGLHFAGFWDFMADSAVRAYDLLRASGSRQLMVMGPWSHNGIAGETTKTAYADYGLSSSPRFSERMLQWFNHWFKGDPLPDDLSEPVSAYIPGGGMGAYCRVALRNRLERFSTSAEERC